MRRHAGSRQPAREQLHVAPEVVRRPQVDEPPLDRGLPEEHRRRRLLSRDGADPRRDRRVEVREPVDRAAPDDLNLTVVGGELGGGERQGSILHHEPPREDGREHRCSCDDADRHEHEPLAAGAEPRPHEPQRETDPNELRHQYGHSTGV